MAKYATTEKQYFCDGCESLVTEREMVGTYSSHDLKKTGGACPGCKTVLWTYGRSPHARDEACPGCGDVLCRGAS